MKFGNWDFDIALKLAEEVTEYEQIAEDAREKAHRARNSIKKTQHNLCVNSNIQKASEISKKILDGKSGYVFAYKGHLAHMYVDKGGSVLYVKGPKVDKNFYFVPLAHLKAFLDSIIGG